MIRPILTTFELALQGSIGHFLARLAQILEINGETLVRNGTRVVGIWLLAWLAYRLVRLAAIRIEKAVDDGDDSVTTLRERRGKTISQLLRSMGRVVIYAIALLLTFNVFIDIGPILAGAGILGLAVSFGAQSLVKDVISGFFVLFENQFAIGDVIEAGGKSGVVEKMTLRVVVLRDLQGAMHIIPNGEIKVVSNLTRGWSRAVVDVGVGYEEDVDRALSVVRDEAARKKWMTQSLAFAVIFDGSCYPDFNGDGSLDLFDFLAFVNSFNADEPGADCTGDGTLDLFDFLCFVNSFNAGC